MSEIYKYVSFSTENLITFLAWRVATLAQNIISPFLRDEYTRIPRANILVTHSWEVNVRENREKRAIVPRVNIQTVEEEEGEIYESFGSLVGSSLLPRTHART